MSGDYFVMIKLPNGTRPMMLEGEDQSHPDVYFFASFHDADSEARQHTACQAFGYEVFCMGDGVHLA